jgi:hypothetical protein
MEEKQLSYTNMKRLFEIAEREKKPPQVCIIELPKCRMATSGPHAGDDMENLMKFPNWWDEYNKKCQFPLFNFSHDSYMFDDNGMGTWWCVVEKWATSADCGGYEIFDFEGGLYAYTTGIDEDSINGPLMDEIKEWLPTSNFELDECPGHRIMFSMVSPSEKIKKGLGYHQSGIYVPSKLKDADN